MPDSEVQGAVCGTCGQPPCQCGDARLGAHHTEAWYADHDFTLPAPVVPSDDHEHLHRHVDARGLYIWHEHVHSHDAATQHDEDDYEDSQHSHGNDPSHGTYEVSARGHIREPTAGAAPPTPSQDAEGDRLNAAWRKVMRHHGRGAEGCPECREYIESAIRERYEALVRRGRAVLDDQQAEYECGFCSGSNADHEDECVIPPFAAALTSIEESLGGRKDA